MSSDDAEIVQNPTIYQQFNLPIVNEFIYDWLQNQINHLRFH